MSDWPPLLFSTAAVVPTALGNRNSHNALGSKLESDGASTRFCRGGREAPRNTLAAAGNTTLSFLLLCLLPPRRRRPHPTRALPPLMEGILHLTPPDAASDPDPARRKERRPQLAQLLVHGGVVAKERSLVRSIPEVVGLEARVLRSRHRSGLRSTEMRFRWRGRRLFTGGKRQLFLGRQVRAPAGRPPQPPQ